MSHLDLIHSTRRPLRWALATAAAVALFVVLAAPRAWADGDPASDVLASQALFVPQDAGMSAGQQASLQALLGAGRRAGYDLHVAVIARATDLGSVGALWRQPGGYARFLGQEIGLVVHGPLLVVMPGGYGYVPAAGTPRADPSAVAGLPAPRAALGAATIAAVRHVAAGSGHPLALVAVTPRHAGASSDGALVWGVFAAGWLAVLAAWGMSLRARPLRWRSGATRA